MPPVTPRAIRAISTPNDQRPTSKPLAVGSWRLDGSLLYFDDLAAQDFLLRDGDFLVPLFARDSAVQQLPGALACEDDEFEPVFFRCSFHDFLSGGSESASTPAFAARLRTTGSGLQVT